jgi:hypothetical protein
MRSPSFQVRRISCQLPATIGCGTRWPFTLMVLLPPAQAGMRSVIENVCGVAVASAISIAESSG